GLAAGYPVILGGAALTRAYVEQDLHEIYDGEVRYARDAFEGLRLMDALIGIKRGAPGAQLPGLKQRRVRAAAVEIEELPETGHVRSEVATDVPVPAPPFWGTRVVKGIQLKEYASWLDEGALFKGQWGLKQARTGEGPTYEELLETEGRPRLRGLLDRLQTENLLEAAVVHGYFPCVSKDDDLILLDEAGNERTRFTFPRQRRGRRLCLADFFRPEESGETDVVGLQVVTVGSRIGEETARLFEADAYRDYLELHGLSVQLAEALAEYWHARVRTELGIAADDPRSLDGMLRTEYQGCRYSLGYPACPDLADRAKIAHLLRPQRIGVHLSEEFQLHPEQSTDALVVHHPEANYFNAGGRA
uniref:vitamin B12 dependent-methionine synthase activation domain-containing protein n=1 Tax=Streptomyces sp. HNS054 TaxID=1662446 RepID=UPI000653B818